MKITIESTPDIVECNGAPARVWRGETERGVAVVALVARVAVDDRSDTEAFDRELCEMPAPTAARERDLLLSAVARAMAANLVASTGGR